MNSEKHQELRTRTKAFALRVIRMSQALPRSREANVLVQQVLRSATGMAANYRAAGRSRSKAEFIAKIGVVVEEADETVFWLEMLLDSGMVRPRKTEESACGSNTARGYIHSITEDRQKLGLVRFRAITAIPSDSGDLPTSVRFA